ncbi:hypothetical protein [Paraburkholderia sp. BR10882]|uniref:hypothetical protein n=1 Tax=unclassified Paraburkholderia TaxID=2615204 RepID=UPI0034CDF711
MIEFTTPKFDIHQMICSKVMTKKPFEVNIEGYSLAQCLDMYKWLLAAYGEMEAEGFEFDDSKPSQWLMDLIRTAKGTSLYSFASEQFRSPIALTYYVRVVLVGYEMLEAFLARFNETSNEK